MNLPNCESCLTRRKFLSTSTLLAAGIATGCATTSVYRVISEGGQITINPADYPELSQSGGVIQLRLSSHPDPLILVRQKDTYQAFSAVCTHLRCFVRPSKHFLLCPCHGSTFDLSGKVVRGPAEQPLARFPTETSDRGILIRID